MTKPNHKPGVLVRVAETVEQNKFSTIVTSILMLVVVFFGPQFSTLKGKLAQTENLLRVVNEVLVDNSVTAEEVVLISDALKAFKPVTE